MAAFALTDCFFSLNGTDRSTYVKSVALSYEGAELDATAMSGSSGWMVPITGMKSGSIQLTFNNDVAASAIDAVIYPIMFTTVAFVLRPTSAVKGASNPEWTGSLLVREWNFGGSVGELASVSVTWPLSGAVTRATS